MNQQATDTPDLNPYHSTLERLRNAIELKNGFSFNILRIENLALDRAVLTWLMDTLGHRVAEIQAGETPVAAALSSMPVDADNALIYVHDLHNVPASEIPAEFQRLNEQRDVIAEHVHCPLFLVLSEPVMRLFIEHAPDFWSIRSGTYYFAEPAPRDALADFEDEVLESAETYRDLIRSLEASGSADARLDASLHLKLGKALVAAGQIDEGADEFSLALVQAKAAQAEDLEAEARLQRVRARGGHGEDDERELLRAIVSFQKAGNAQGITRATLSLARLLYLQARPGTALEMYTQLVRDLEATPYKRELATALLGQADVLAFLARDSDAMTAAERALVLFEHLGAKDSIARALLAKARLHLRLKDAHRALSHAKKAASIAKEHGRVVTEATAQAVVGKALTALSQYSDAIAAQKYAAELFHALGNTRGEAGAWVDLAQCEFMRRNLDATAAALDRAETLSRQNNDLQGIANVELFRGRLQRERNQ